MAAALDRALDQRHQARRAYPHGATARRYPLDAALEQAGLRVTMLPELTDVDTVREAQQVAAMAPDSRFAACMSRLREDALQPVAVAR